MVEGTNSNEKPDILKFGDPIRVVYSDGPNREARTVTGTLVRFDERFLTIESGRLTLVIGGAFILRIERWTGERR